MPSGYSRVTPFAGVASTPICVELPLPPRGILERIILTQLSGTPGAGTVVVYNRKGACSTANDLNVAESGSVVTVDDEGGMARVLFDADHNLIVGATFEVKGCSTAAYNVTHTVTAVMSSILVVTDVAAGGAGGLWQTTPFNATNNPASHIVYEGTIASGSLKEFDINRGYENSDNQSETMRARYQALWAEITPTETGNYEIAATAEAEAVA
jgi:hypothetical protein